MARKRKGVDDTGTELAVSGEPVPEPSVLAKTVGNRTALDVLADLRWIFLSAKKKGDYKSALRAIELEGKHLGVFTVKAGTTEADALRKAMRLAEKRSRVNPRKDVIDIVPVNVPEGKSTGPVYEEVSDTDRMTEEELADLGLVGEEEMLASEDNNPEDWR